MNSHSLQTYDTWKKEIRYCVRNELRDRICKVSVKNVLPLYNLCYFETNSSESSKIVKFTNGMPNNCLFSDIFRRESKCITSDSEQSESDRAIPRR